MLNRLKRIMGSQDARRVTRLKVDLPVDIGLSGSGVPAMIVNLSNDGAKLCCFVAPMVGQQVEIQWEGKRLAAKVQWAKRKHFGVLFDTALTNNQIVAMIAPQPDAYVEPLFVDQHEPMLQAVA